MSMVGQEPDMDDLDERDRDVLRVLSEGRANPKLIRDATGLSKGDANTVLVRLGRGGLVRQVTRGLYEITDEGLEEIDADAEERASVDVAALRRALDDVERAVEQGDKGSLREALTRAQEALNDAG